MVKVEPASMLYWYPKVKDLTIPQPKTKFILLSDEELKELKNENLPSSVVNKFKKACESIGYPVFLRTDLASGKHEWKDACFVEGAKNLAKNILGVVGFNLVADLFDLDFKALVVREYIPMDAKYTAFNGMPVNPERRYFIEDGKVLCHHPYWIEEAITNASIPNWREISKRMNTEKKSEVNLLTKCAKLIAQKIDGFWSVDFCKAKDGRWIFIDMNEGDRSWHPLECKFNRTPEIDYCNLTDEAKKILQKWEEGKVELNLNALKSISVI